ncbi:MAG TPA: RNA polymerase sigma factor [Pirellulales bacterium]
MPESPASELPKDRAPGAPADSLPAEAGPAGSTPPDALRLDLAQLAALCVEHALELRRFLRGVLRSEELAEDALQSAFAKAIEVGHTASPASFKGWLFRVAMNEALAVRRRQKVHHRTIERLAAEERSPESRAERDSPVRGLIRWERVETVRRAIGRLTADQRQVVEMRIDQEKTFVSIAEELRLPLGTVLSRMQAALKRLRSELDDLGSR